MIFLDLTHRLPALLVCAAAVGAVAGCGVAGSSESPKPRYGVLTIEPSAPLAPVRAVPEASHLGHEFIGNYVAMWNYAVSTGKTAEFSDLIAADCQTCVADVAAISRLATSDRSDYPRLRLIDAAFHSDGSDRWTKRFQAHLQWGDGAPTLVDMDLVVQRESIAADADEAKVRERGWRMKRIERLPIGFYATAHGAKTPPSLVPLSSGKASSGRPSGERPQNYPGHWLDTPTELATPAS